MRRTAALLLALVLVLPPVANAQAKLTRPAAMASGSASTVREINALNARWQDAIDARSASRSAALYASDAIFMVPNAPKATGRGIQAAWEGIFKTPGIALKLHPQSVTASADATMAYDVGSYDFKFTTPAGPGADRGKYLVVWKKVNGEWKVAADIFNSDLPAAH